MIPSVACSNPEHATRPDWDNEGSTSWPEPQQLILCQIKNLTVATAKVDEYGVGCAMMRFAGGQPLQVAT